MKRLITIITLLCIVIGCEQNPDEPILTDTHTDPPLTSEQLQMIDDAPSTPVELENIILPNGRSLVDFLNEYDPTFLSSVGGRKATTNLTPQNQKNLLIARMMGKAYYLTNRSNHQDNGQNGLAYVYGGKTLNKMTPAGECNTEQLVGLDCSGFIYQLTQAAGLLTIPSGKAIDQGDTAKWNKAFKQSNEYTKLIAERINNIEASGIIAGDLIYFIKNGEVPHTAIALNDESGTLKFFQSNGTSVISGDCEKNKGLSRGPRFWHLTPANLQVFGDSYYVIRPTADISGSWTMKLRCEGKTTDAITVDLIFKTKNDNSFTALGSGFDYGGETVVVTINGFYNKKENKLQGELQFSFPSYPGDERIDTFEVVLNEDETPYIVTAKKIDNGGCVGEIKLTNKEKNG